GGLLELRPGPAGWQARPLFDAAMQRQHPELKDVSSVMADASGDVWFGCAQRLCRFGAKGLRFYGATARPLAEPLSNLLRMPDGRLWARSARLLWRLEPDGEALVRVPMPGPTQFSSTWAPMLEADSQGRILTQWGGGLARWDGARWDVVAEPQGLQAGGGVNSLIQVRDGSVWLGTAGAGLAQWLGYRHAQTWGVAEGLPSDETWAFLRTRAGILYFGTAAGLGAGAGPHPLVRGSSRTASEIASSLVEDAQGRVWIGSFNGPLSVFDPSTRRQRHVAYLPRITRLLRDGSGLLWVVTHRGIFHVEPGRDERPRRVDAALFPPDTQIPDAHDACLSGNGQVWINTRQGLLRGEGRRLQRVRLLDADGRPLTDTALIAIACEGDQLWLGGGAGLWRAKADPEAAVLRLERVQAPLLVDRGIVALHADRRGWLWVGTDYGVAVWNRSRWRFIRQDAGLPWNDCNQGALYEDVDGSIWIGTTRGAGHLVDLNAIFELPGLSVRAEVNGVFSGAGSDRAGLVVPWKRRSLELHLDSPSFEQRSALRFEYRMQGQDEAWRSGTETALVYPSLQAGHYRFEVRARNLDMQVESELESLDIEVQPPWWGTPWFYVLAAGTVLLLGWAALRWRLRRLMARQAELERVVAERTREIEASHARMRELALKDGLTGVLNRRALEEALTAEVARATRGRKLLAVVMIDADRFKLINDQHGHPAGDAVLQAIAQRLQRPTRSYDVLGRYGGEEFLLLLPDLDADSAEGRARLETFHRAICGQPVPVGEGREVTVTCSFGVACLRPGHEQGAAALIAGADAALYRAKQNGRNRIEYAPPSPAA
ncbi:MAG TPA: diguanylate cyclase, partial [Burkholderiaceae bacterium]|nr:diguanylate cyclase [Burkholderiaceae bacterium]